MLRAERNQACMHFGRDVKGLNIPMLRDVKGYMILNIPLLYPRSGRGDQNLAVRILSFSKIVSII